MKLSLRNFNAYTVVAFIILLVGIIFYIMWGLRYNVWADVGIYSITIVLVLTGILGMILSLSREKTEEQQ